MSLWTVFLARFVVSTFCVPLQVHHVFWCFLPPPFAVLFFDILFVPLVLAAFRRLLSSQPWPCGLRAERLNPPPPAGLERVWTVLKYVDFFEDRPRAVRKTA